MSMVTDDAGLLLDSHTPLYVNAEVLTTFPNPHDFSKVNAYKINDTVFYETRTDDKELVKFEIHAERVKTMGSDCDKYCSTPTDSESEYEDTETNLELTIQQVPNGIIINQTIYLSENQWNTMVFTDQSLVECAVCDVVCTSSTCTDHLRSRSHLQALTMFPPLSKFDISITRQIRDSYHCGVCNELFGLPEADVHFSSKMHQDMLLFAINKTTDIMYNFEVQSKKKDCIHFSNNAVDTDSNYSDDDRYSNEQYINFQNDYNNDCSYDYDYDEECINLGTSYATMAKKPKEHVQNHLEIDLGTKKVSVSHDSWHMIIIPEVNRIYCMVCQKYEHLRMKTEHCKDKEHLRKLEKCHVVEAYEEYFIRKVDDKLYHCGHCNNLQLINEIQDHIEVTHPRKNKIFDKNLIHKHDNGDKEFNNNAIPSTPIKKAVEMPSTHINKAINMPSTPIKKTIEIPSTPIKKANDMPSPIKKAIDKPSPIKLAVDINQYDSRSSTPRSGISQSSNRSTPINNNIINTKIGVPLQYINDRATPVFNDKVNDANDNGDIYKINDITNMTGVFGDIIIYPFGNKLTISLLSYNIVCKRPNDFYCGLCDFVCPVEIISGHIYNVMHIQLLQRTPFIQPFGNNLIRAVRDKLHCSICNIPVTAVEIYRHIGDPQHSSLVIKAMSLMPVGGIVSNPLSKDISSCNVHNASSSPVIPSNDNLISFNDILTPSKIPVASEDINIPFNEIPTPNNMPIASKKIPTAPNDIPIAYKNIAIAPTDIGSNKISFVSTDNLSSSNKITNNFSISKENNNDSSINASPKNKSITPNSKSFPTNDDSFSSDDNEIDEFNDSFSSEDATFDAEEYVYLKLKNTYIKISNTSYNTLVQVGDGSRYCFVCAEQIEFARLQRHVDSRSHLDCMEKYRFLDKYEDHLLRQIYLMYHCSICNVIINRKELKIHLDWPTHALQNENTQKNIKKIRKNEIKGGIKQIIVSTQKENIHLNEKEPSITIHLNVRVKNKNDEINELCKKHKIIIFHDNVLKINWQNWNGVSTVKNGFKCILCQRELKENEVVTHCSSEWHNCGLDKPFEKGYAPALIRKINDSTLNCLICNTEVSNKDHLVVEHIKGKKHVKHYDEILTISSMANSYTDCNEDVLML